MKNKSAGTSEVVVAMSDALGSEGAMWTHQILEKLWNGENIPEDWRTSILVPVYKEKGDVLECGNHRGIKLLEHLLKVEEKILDQKMREVMVIGNMQFGFRLGRGTTDAAYGRELDYWCLWKKGVPEDLINIVKDTYKSVTTKVRTSQGTSEEFEVKVGLHQGSSLSSLLFIIVIDVVSEECRRGLLWEMLFAGDLVISATGEKNLETKLRKWKKALEGRGLKVNMKKTVVMRSSKGARRKINTKEESSAKYDQVYKFKYFGSTMASEGGCEGAEKDRVKAAWAKWREVSAVMCDKKLPAKLKSKMYKTVIRPVLLYGAEIWALGKKEESLLQRTEMRMLRWMLGISLREQRTNEDVLAEAGVTSISSKTEEARLIWFGHVKRRVRKKAYGKRWICLSLESGAEVDKERGGWIV
ncbi:uncharacterized protein LOC125038865 [Penaeus chinensis]|uniref:uncharacterized protein LOC125038865 n=1 Tax=Penaeus chinensis TaxID=139456 RepID=UPI001FB5A4F1|nr:uncharacterized protein LOC125038865 [Penaeus chinensis]